MLANGRMSLWDQDEAAYAGFGMRMLRSGQWLVPDFIWSDVHRKVPFHFWSIASSFGVFGIHTWALRLPAMLAIWGTMAWIGLGMKSLLNRDERLVGMVILGGSFLVNTLGKISVTDGMLLFFSTGTAVCLLRFLTNPDWRWALFCWVNVSLAMLTKGPPVLVLGGGLALLLLIWHPKRWHLLRLHPWFGFPLALAPLIYWGFQTSQADGGAFIDWLIDWYIVKRVAGSVFGQTGPPGTHLGIMWLCFLPWLVTIPGVLRRIWHGLKKRDQIDGLLASWWVAGWLIYEFSPSKLPAYAVAAHVPFALLIARELLDWQTRRPRKAWLFVQGGLQSLLIIGLPIAAWWIDGFGLLFWSAIFASFLTSVSLIYAWSAFNKESFPRLISLTQVVFLLSVWGWVLPNADRLKDAPERVATYLESATNPQTQVLIGNDFGQPPSLPFYLERNGHQVSISKEVRDHLHRFNSNDAWVLVLNERQKEELMEKVGDWPVRQITSLLVDRQGRADYFVILNSAAQEARD